VQVRRCGCGGWMSIMVAWLGRLMEEDRGREAFDRGRHAE
jgi:hypothetical protein